MKDHQEVGKLIAKWGLEKFLEIVGEQCAEFSHQIRSTDSRKEVHLRSSFQKIGENIRALAADSRRDGIQRPFVLNHDGNLKPSTLGRDFGSCPIWIL